MANELALYLEELQAVVKRPRIVSLTNAEISKSRKAFEKAWRIPDSHPYPYALVKTPAAVPAVNYSALSTFRWDQHGDKVKLHKKIVPEKCKVIVKSSRVIISLIKASEGNWLYLLYKEDSVGEIYVLRNPR
ncbi:hypothetical protein QQ045_026788 [Rhodiola kirilowii]